MIDRGADKGQADGDRDGAVEIHHFGRDVSLVVIERQHGVKGTFPGQMEDGIGGDGADDIQTEGAGVSDGGFQFPGFLMAEQAMFAAMGVKSGDRQSGAGYTQSLERLGAPLEVVENPLARDQFDRPCQGNMSAEEEDFQVKNLKQG